jgi:hypothetical protein
MRPLTGKESESLASYTAEASVKPGKWRWELVPEKPEIVTRGHWPEDDDLASNNQVGGGHYKDMAIEPGEYAEANNLSPLEFNVVKYVSRKKDNKLEDYRKAIHCLQLKIEWDEKYGDE